MTAATIHITVLLFAHLRDALSTDRMSLDLPAGSTVTDAIRTLCELHPPIAVLHNSRSLAFAVNEQYAPLTAPLPDNCTLALIPPVSGG